MAAPRVAVCVATFRRPALLGELLESLGALTFDRLAPEVRVVVVDNDAAGSAAAVVEAARASFPVPLDYEVEPRRNISLARNRAVARALAWGAGFVAFVDDDEVVRPDWLDRLLVAQACFGADVVAGVVLPRLPADAPAWTRRGGFFTQPQPPSGTPLPVASTNNVLVDASLLRGTEPFDPAFGITGSGDSLFFLGCARRGARLVAAPDAVVEETVPPERARARWVLRRAFRGGNAAVFCERAMPPEHRQLGLRVLKATARLVASAAVLPPALLLGRAAALRALWGVSYGAGCLAAVAGYRYAEYRDPKR